MSKTWKEPWAQARYNAWGQTKPTAGNIFASRAQECNASPTQQNAKLPPGVRKLKRKAKNEAYTSRKKQKVTAATLEATHSRWDKTEGFQPTTLQPIFGATNRPLTNVERWRLRGWTWPEAMVRVEDNHELRMESPRGTAFPSNFSLQLNLRSKYTFGFG